MEEGNSADVWMHNTFSLTASSIMMFSTVFRAFLIFSLPDVMGGGGTRITVSAFTFAVSIRDMRSGLTDSTLSHWLASLMPPWMMRMSELSLFIIESCVEASVAPLCACILALGRAFWIIFFIWNRLEPPWMAIEG